MESCVEKMVRPHLGPVGKTVCSNTTSIMSKWVADVTVPLISHARFKEHEYISCNAAGVKEHRVYVYNPRR